MTRARVIAVIVSCVAIVGAGLSILRANRSVARRDADLDAARTRAASIIEDTPVGAAPGDALVASTIEAAASAMCPDVDQTLRAALARDVGAFLLARFGGGATPESYARWSESRGAAPVELDELRSFWRIDDAYAQYGGQGPLPDAFADRWAATWAAASACDEPHVLRLASLASQREGYSVLIGRVTQGEPRWPMPSDPVSEAMAVSDATHTSHSWWRHPRGWREQLRDGGSALVARVSFIAQTPDGRRGVVCLDHVWDESSATWVLQSFSTTLPARLEY